MKNDKWSFLARLADILTLIGFIPILIGGILWGVGNMNWTLFLEICLATIFLVSLIYSITYRLKRLKEWVFYTHPNYKKQHFDNLEEKINYIIDTIMTGKGRRENLIDPAERPYHDLKTENENLKNRINEIQEQKKRPLEIGGPALTSRTLQEAGYEGGPGRRELKDFEKK